MVRSPGTFRYSHRKWVLKNLRESAGRILLRHMLFHLIPRDGSISIGAWVELLVRALLLLAFYDRNDQNTKSGRNRASLAPV